MVSKLQYLLLSALLVTFKTLLPPERKRLAAENGVSVKKCQSAADKRSLQFQHVIPKKQPRLTPEINPLPSMCSTLTDQPDPEIIDDSSCLTESQYNMTDGGAKVQVIHTVCIARTKTSCDYAKVISIWKTKVDISYLKKTTKGLIPWMLPGNKLNTDSVHINSIFYSLGNQLELSEADLHAIKNKLKDIFS